MFLFILISFLSINSISSTTYTCNTNISCGCSSLTTIVTSKIVGGEAAPNHAWGWIVSLQRSGSHICGASLLTSEYAVTAGHCVNDVINNFSKLSILAGTNYLNDVSSTNIQRRSIIKIYLHPNYDSTDVLNDIAILQFTPLSITSNSNLAFICLPQAYQDPFQTNTNLVAIGWGVTSENSNTVSNSLRQVTVQVFSSTSTACQQAEIINSSLQFCAGVSAGGKDTCQGDSGGPLMAFVNNSWILAGLTSTGVGCAQAGYPGLYTRVSYYISFINSIIKSSQLVTTTVLTTTVLTTTVRTTTVRTTTIQQNSTQSNFRHNNGNIRNKSIPILILCFSIFNFVNYF